MQAAYLSLLHIGHNSEFQARKNLCAEKNHRNSSLRKLPHTTTTSTDQPMPRGSRSSPFPLSSVSPNTYSGHGKRRASASNVQAWSVLTNVLGLPALARGVLRGSYNWVTCATQVSTSASLLSQKQHFDARN